ncbi:O-antigen ligase family protein [Terrabacter sp. LjRoot27]
MVLVVAAVVAQYAASASARQTPLLLTASIGVCLVLATIVLSRRDVVAVLTLLLGLLFLVPQNLVLAGPLRSVGNPSVLLGLGCFVLWAAGRLNGSLRAAPLHPVRWAVFAFVVTAMTSFAAAMSRFLTAAESQAAARNLFQLLAMVGIAMFAVDGLRTAAEVTTLLRRLIVLGAIQGLIGILEFSTSFSYQLFQAIPGLTLNGEAADDTRAGFTRVAAAATHSIEFSVALAAMAPIALHFAMQAQSEGQRRKARICLVLILVALPLTIARSGIVAATVGLFLYWLVLPSRTRLNLALVGILGLAFFRVAVPGILGTLSGFFLAGENDSSIAARTADYDLIGGLMSGHWWFGRGFGTFDPIVYFFLDNEYLMTLLNGGLAALASFIALFVIGAGLARGARKRLSPGPTRDLAQALSGSILALAVAAGTFDELTFRQCSFLLFLLLGCAGALWTVARRAETVAGDDSTVRVVTQPDGTPMRAPAAPDPGAAQNTSRAGSATTSSAPHERTYSS